ncbi:MAG: ATP-dependent helicase, partial [Bradyrhizobium sp.]
GEGEAMTSAEEVRNIVTADDAGSGEDADANADVNDGAGETATAHADGVGASSRDVGPDPWQALAQVGSQFIAALAAANNPNAPARPWIERDPATGVQSLKMPLPPPETARQLANALSALADSLRGRIA